MRSFEIIPPEANRPGSRLQPKRRGVASIQKDSECIPSDPDIVVAEVNPFGFAGRDFKRSVHVFVPGLKFSRNHKARLSAKVNQVRRGGEPHHPFGFLFAAGAVNARDEPAKLQDFLPAIRFHALKYKPGNRADAMGCFPHDCFSWIQPRRGSDTFARGRLSDSSVQPVIGFKFTLPN
jgi:hypothetical protein